MRIAIRGVYGDASWANVLWVQHTVSAPPAQADIDYIAAAVAAAHNNRFKANMSDATLWLQVSATYFEPGGLIMQTVTNLSTGGANTSGTNLSSATATGVSWTAGVYWRGGKPRTYLVGMRSAFLASGSVRLWNSTHTSNIKTDATNFLADVNALTHGTITATALGFVSFRSGNADRVPPLFFPYTGATCHPRVDTQRRRLGRETL